VKPESIIHRVRSLAEAEGLSAIICVSPESVAYTAGFVIPSQPLMRWRHAATVITVAGAEAIVCVDMEETTVRTARPDIEVRVWAEFGGNAMHVLAELIKDLDLATGRIGIEAGYLSIRDHSQLVERLPEVTLVPADELLVRSRQVKTSEELALLSRLSKISDTAILDSFRAVRAGSTEMDIASTLTRSVYEQGAQQFKLLIVATGERSQLPNVGPTLRVLQPGDICRVEIFSVIDGYHAGVCRTAVVGDPSPAADRIYRNLVECKHAVFDAIRPGASSQNVYKVFRKKFDELGLSPISFIGHSIGVNLHEKPYLGPYSDQLLEVGMVLGMEPLVYRSGHGFGMQIKDMVAIGENGAQLLSNVTDTDSLYRIEA
jgi:Xaa-Pro dipeptidase